MLPANREFHVVAGVVIFPTHPGLRESELGFARYGSANRGRRGVFGPFEDSFPIKDSGSNIEEINNLKKQLSKQFAMKDLGPAKQIHGMRIIRDRANGTLKLSQTEYVKKILSRFSMDKAKPISTPLGSHFRLTMDQSPKTEQEQAYMSKVSYTSAIGSLMYAMVCTRPDIAHAVGVVSRYMSNPGKQHWEAIKWILRYLKRYFRHISLLHRS
uniref:Reverse transcriptase Ty1/copia-type domain-containing protein n=1 Tax=Fagus sylvatica TaxID=28930 RepID=A0A2N9HDQ7_FAGSY